MYLIYRKVKYKGNTVSVENENVGLQIPNILIGDSQTLYVANASSKFKLISRTGSESALWLGGQNLNWLKNAVGKFQYSPNVKNVAIVIGTNERYNMSGDVSGLFSNLRKKFPNARFFAIKGSWGWGGVSSITPTQVNNYYQLFANKGATVIDPAIGYTDNPHGNYPIYQTIAHNLDSSID